MTEWNLRSRSHQCLQCATAFTDGECCRSVAAVFQDEIVQEILAEKIAAQAADPKSGKPPEFVRLDFCQSCWEELKKRRWISMWQSTYVAPAPAKPEPLPRETAESLLRKLVESDDTGEHTAVIFILAVMLERKKILIERRTKHTPDGGKVRIYEHKKTGEIMFITDPDLQVDEIPGLQVQVQLLLEPPVESSAAAEDSTEIRD